jgi:hypothetical protein
MRSSKVMGVLAIAGCVALAGTAGAQVTGAGKSSITIVTTPAPAPATATPKTAGSVSSKAQATIAGKPPTGGGAFALKLSKDVGDATKPGFSDGEYVLEIESSGTPTGDVVGSPLAAAFFITLTISGGKCTIHNHPDFNPGSPNCGGANPPCAAAEAAGKCSAQIYQVAGNLLAAAGLVANQPFGARFRIRTNPTPASCSTGHLMLQATAPTPTPPSSTCRTGTVVGVGGVALGTAS